MKYGNDEKWTLEAVFTLSWSALTSISILLQSLLKLSGQRAFESHPWESVFRAKHIRCKKHPMSKAICSNPGHRILVGGRADTQTCRTDECEVADGMF